MSARLSYTAIRKLEVSSGQNLKFVLDKQGKQVLLGQGSYGEVTHCHWKSPAKANAHISSPGAVLCL